MYKIQLIRKYLIKRRIAWVALVAVVLCTAMVLVVVSVMGGWLRVFVNSFHGMTGDVVITTSSLTGFPYYEEMIDRVRKEVPGVKTAVPIIRSGGLLNIANLDVEIVQVLGYPTNIGEVNDWQSTLHTSLADRKKDLTSAVAAATTVDDQQRLQSDIARLPFALRPDVNYRDYVSRRVKDPRNRPGMIVSSVLAQIKRGDPQQAEEARDRMYRFPVSLTLVPVTGGEGFDKGNATDTGYWIVDDSSSQIWQLDNNTVYISFDQAQQDLRMTAHDGAPARCSEVEIKAIPGADLLTIKNQVDKIVGEVRDVHSEDFSSYSCKVMTWEEQQGTFIKAVQHEVVLTTALFGVISSVAVLLILCIFYMIVVEKTKDIGIIKSVGATGAGILSMFLGYGLVIGLVGAALGFGAAYVIVHNINEIHSWLGRRMGIVIWSPETYQFEKIPNNMETHTVVYVLVVAVLAAVAGALLPALKAAVMNPVDALRYE